METGKTSLKTLDKLSQIPLVSSAITNAGDYYGKVKERNLLFRTYFNLAELSLRTVAYAAAPITTFVKKPLENVDNYLCDKVDLLESSYPAITKPTEQITATAYTHAKSIYDKNLKQHVDTISQIKDVSVKKVGDIKEYGTEKLTKTIDTIKIYGSEQLSKSAATGYTLVNSCLEQDYIKKLTKPILDIAEKSIDYLIPLKPQESQDKPATSEANSEVAEATTLKRFYDINKNAADRVIQSTFEKFVYLNVQFDTILKKLEQLKRVVDNYTENSRQKISTYYETNKMSLKALSSQYINKNNISLARLEALVRSYYSFIINDVNTILSRYFDALKNLPIVCNGTRLKQTTAELLNKLNKEPLATLLKSTIEQVSVLRDSLASFVDQLFNSLKKSENIQDNNKTKCE